MSAQPSCLIVGAGMAGLTAASALSAGGWQVTVVDKGRGVGGRMATRRIGDARFDHGAQFFTVRDPKFQEQVELWVGRGWVAPWFEDGGHVRNMVIGGMSQLAKHLAAPLNVRTGVKLSEVRPLGRGWKATSDTGETYDADALLLTAPPEQSLALLGDCAGGLADGVVAELQAVDFDPCFALMVLLNGPSQVPEPGYFRPESGPLEWLADNSRKGVSAGLSSALTVHATGDFSRLNFDRPTDEVASQLLAAAAPWLGSSVESWQLHRWKYAKPVAGTWPGSLFSQTPSRVAFAGDGLAGGRVEGAFISGLAAARSLKY